MPINTSVWFHKKALNWYIWKRRWWTKSKGMILLLTFFKSLVRVGTEGADSQRELRTRNTRWAPDLGLAVQTPGVKKQRNSPGMRPFQTVSWRKRDQLSRWKTFGFIKCKDVPVPSTGAVQSAEGSHFSKIFAPHLATETTSTLDLTTRSVQELKADFPVYLLQLNRQTYGWNSQCRKLDS